MRGKSKEVSIISGGIVFFIVLLALVYYLFFRGIDSVSFAAETVKVSTFQDFKKHMESSGTKIINLGRDIVISERIVVEGNKVVNGKGYELRRKWEAGQLYKGTMLTVGNGASGATLRILDITVNGSCQNPNFKMGVDGRLIEVSSSGSNLVIDSGATLTGNYNSQSELDGGGAIVIMQGSQGTMKAGSQIYDNRSMTGGGAVRIHGGGRFIISGGRLYRNSVSVNRKMEGYDGLGGCIHNCGYLGISGGEIYENEASGKEINGVVEGGLGGGIFNAGQINMTKGTIGNNQAYSGGGGIYSTSSGKVKMTGGRIEYNQVTNSVGGGIYINQGSQFDFRGGSIAYNRANTGGGIYISKPNSQVTMSGGYIYGNIAENDNMFQGAGIRNNESILTITGGVIGKDENDRPADNRCPKGAGEASGTGILNSGVLTITGGVIASSNSNARVIVNLEKGQFSYISKGTAGVRGIGKHGIYNVGQMWVGERSSGNTPEIVGQFDVAVTNYGELMVYHGKLEGTKIGIENFRDISIKNGLVTGEFAVVERMGALFLEGGELVGREYDLFVADGDIIMRSKPILDKIFLGKNVYIKVANQLRVPKKSQLTPDEYVEGRLLAKTTYVNGTSHDIVDDFELKPNKLFYCKENGEGIYIGVKRYQVQFHSNGGTGTMANQMILSNTFTELKANSYKKEGEVFLGWSDRQADAQGVLKIQYKNKEKVKDIAEVEGVIHLYAVWGKPPIIKKTKEIGPFYEDEIVEDNLLLEGMEAVDQNGKNLTGSLQITEIQYADGRTKENQTGLNTEKAKIGDVLIIYQVKGETGIVGEYQLTTQILPNEMPRIKSPERYFFMSEIYGKTIASLEKRCENSLVIEDDRESSGELHEYYKVEDSSIQMTPGIYKMTVSVKDQFGSRYYMEPYEKRKYGKGKVGKLELRVHIVQDTQRDPFANNEGYIRFIGKEYMSTLSNNSKWRQSVLQNQLVQSLEKSGDRADCEEMWEFSSDEITEAKQFMGQRKDPFSTETNQRFIGIFEKKSCKGGGKSD